MTAPATEAEAGDAAELGGRLMRRRLAEAGRDGASDSAAAIKALREARPGLTLQQAVHLARPPEGR